MCCNSVIQSEVKWHRLSKKRKRSREWVSVWWQTECVCYVHKTTATRNSGNSVEIIKWSKLRHLVCVGAKLFRCFNRTNYLSFRLHPLPLRRLTSGQSFRHRVISFWQDIGVDAGTGDGHYKQSDGNQSRDKSNIVHISIGRYTNTRTRDLREFQHGARHGSKKYGKPMNSIFVIDAEIISWIILFLLLPLLFLLRVRRFVHLSVCWSRRAPSLAFSVYLRVYSLVSNNLRASANYEFERKLYLFLVSYILSHWNVRAMCSSLSTLAPIPKCLPKSNYCFFCAARALPSFHKIFMHSK